MLQRSETPIPEKEETFFFCHFAKMNRLGFREVSNEAQMLLDTRGHLPSLAAVLQVKPGLQSSGLLISSGIQPGSYKTQEINSTKGGWGCGEE